jgi:phosphoserine aminotransferase
MLSSKKHGPAGTTLVIVKEEILGKSGRVIPSILIMKSISKQKACTIHLLYFQSMLY